MITDRIGLHEVLLLVNHNYYNLQKKKTRVEQISPMKTMFKVKIRPF